MKKRIIREREGTIIVIDIVLYIAIIFIGYLLVDYENYNIVPSFNFMPGAFYLISALSFAAYFLNRKRDYYEFLLFSVINLATGTYILFNGIDINYVGKLVPDDVFVLGDALLFYSITSILNKLYIAKKFWDNKNINFIPKVVNSALLIFISILAVYSLYVKVDVAYMIVGYYIIGFGLISLLEPFTYILLNNPTINKILISFLKYDREDKLNVKKPKTIKISNRKKITIKEREGSLLKKDENIKNNSKRKKL